MRHSHMIFVSIRMFAAFTLLCGGMYPLAITLLSDLIFPEHSGGSLIRFDSRLIGSELLSQEWNGPGYFQARPSATDYSTVPSAASNLALASVVLRDSLSERRSRFQKENGLPADTNVPVEMLCASGSGLDPHISPEAARMQVNRIVEQRDLNMDQRLWLENLIVLMTEPWQWGILGEPRVNVLRLNLMLNSSPEFRNLKQVNLD